jgi:LDH2 family malate/lactate/ureidoglycolate dehydrogenase
MSGGQSPFPDTPAEDSPAVEAFVRRDDLTETLSHILNRQGLFAADSQHVLDFALSPWADDLGGVNLPYLVAMIRAMDLGEIDPRGRVLVVREKSAMAVLDGSRAAGPVAMAYAIEMAVEKAKVAGIAGIVIKNSSAIDRPELVAASLARHGFVGFIVSSTGRAEFCTPGETTPRVAGHRSAWGVPTAGGLSIVSARTAAQDTMALLDPHATTGPLPEGAAFDKEGRPAKSWNSLRALASLTGGLDLQFGLLWGLLLAGLTEGRLPNERAKKSPFGDDSEHLIIAIEPPPEMVERMTPERLLSHFGQASSSTPATPFRHLAPNPDVQHVYHVSRTHLDLYIELLKEQRINHPWK